MSASSAQPVAFLGQLHALTQVGSTVPGNGDVNPYGVAVIPASEGRLTAGDILVSNFNDKANVQGTGTTLMEVSPAGRSSLFASISALPAGQACPGGIGLTTALAILPGGWVVVGSLPTSHGGVLPSLNPAGCLIVLNDQGTVTETTVIGTDFPWRANKAALILAPTGLALGGNGTLYADDTLTSSVSAIPQALTRTSSITEAAGNFSAGGALDAPLGMTLAPNGDLIVVNGNNGNAVEITPSGKQLATRTLIKNGAGDLFGIVTTGNGILIVNDGTNALDQASG
jgi:hypothetical protein